MELIQFIEKTVKSLLPLTNLFKEKRYASVLKETVEKTVFLRVKGNLYELYYDQYLRKDQILNAKYYLFQKYSSQQICMDFSVEVPASFFEKPIALLKQITKLSTAKDELKHMIKVSKALAESANELKIAM